MTQALERTPTHNPTDTDTGAVFTTTRAVLADALATVGAVIHTRPAVPVLAGVLLRSHGPDLLVSGFDYDTAITVRVPDAVATPGALLVRHRELHKLMGALSRGTPKKQADTMRVTLMGRDAGFATLTLTGTTVPVERLPLVDYPELPKAPPVFARMDSDPFVSLIKRVMPAVGRDDTLPMLTGLKLNPTSTGLLIAGSDRYRLAVGHVDATVSTTDAPAEVLVSGVVLRKILPKFKGTGTLSLGYSANAGYGDLIDLDTGRVSVLCRSHNDGGSFATGTRYLDLFPHQVSTTVTLDRKALLTAAEKAHAVMKASDQAGLPITLTVGGSTVQVAPRLGSGDHYVTTPEIEATVTGPAYDVIGLNPRYFCEALASTFTGAMVTLHIAGPTTPMVLTDAGERFDDPTTYRHLVMPLRLT